MWYKRQRNVHIFALSRHRISESICILCSHTSYLHVLCNYISGLPLDLLSCSSLLTIQYLHCLSSGHVQTILVWPLWLHLQNICCPSNVLIPDPLHPPSEDLNISISASISTSCLLFSVSVSKPKLAREQETWSELRAPLGQRLGCNPLCRLMFALIKAPALLSNVYLSLLPCVRQQREGCVFCL